MTKSELIAECDETANNLTAVKEELKAVQRELISTRLELIAELKKNVALTRLVKLYAERDLGE